ncbi:hypothetical protein BD414DRAFT_429460, partial [Trametes punicea]
FLDAHSLADQYAAGPHSGPSFKMWWMGITKTNAGTVETDEEFAVTLDAVLKKRGCSGVSVESTFDSLAGFRVRKRALAAMGVVDCNDEDELSHDTKVAYPDETQLHGGIILKLKRLHECHLHGGEHNKLGHCYKPEGGRPDRHVHLNNRRLKRWVAAIAAVEATKWIPPDSDDFNAVHNGQLSGSKARGRSGPHQPLSLQPSASVLPTSNTTQVLFMGLISLFNCSCWPAASPVAYSAMNLPLTPHHVMLALIPSSPIPPPAKELHQFLITFCAKKDIDLLTYEGALCALDHTPDIISRVSLSRLQEVMGAVEGRLIKLQIFAIEWTERLDEKRRALM